MVPFLLVNKKNRHKKIAHQKKCNEIIHLSLDEGLNESNTYICIFTLNEASFFFLNINLGNVKIQS
jgi:hypothetical protein